jgi:chromosome segregation ATPase
MDAGILKDRVEEALRQLEDVRNEAEGAENNAYEARNSADSACDYASNARDEADTAETYAINCKRELDNLESTLDGLMDKLKAETGDEVSLDVQIARYTPKIKELRSKGCGADEIAERLSISSVIVNVVLERQDAA